MKEVKINSIWQKIRKFFSDAHLWLGLSSGIIVVLICLSGTIYVFNTEIREMASPELYKATAAKGVKPIQIETLIARVKAVTSGKVISIKIFADPHKTYQFMVKLKDQAEKKSNREGKLKKGNEKSEEEKRPSAFAVNPYTGEVLGNVSESKTAIANFMKTIFSLHRWLLLDKIKEPIIGDLENRKLGSYVSGTATILFTFGVITGIVIWFPKKIQAWKQGLKIKWNGNWKRTNHNIHASLGLYACIFLFLMGITGPQWSFPWYRTALKKTLGTYQSEGFEAPADPVSRFNDNSKPLNIAEYIKMADLTLPYKGDYNISLPKDSSSAITLTKNHTGFFAPPAGDKLVLDQYTAGILKMDVFKDKSFNERLSGSIKAVHVGDVYGMFTKIIYFMACLIGTALPVTGTLIWFNKLKKKSKKQKVYPAKVSSLIP